MQCSKPGPKISIFLTLPKSDSGCEAALPVGNVENFCAFTMAWKHCHYISEVNSTNLGTLLDHLCFYQLFFLSEMLLFFHEILAEYAYSFLRLIFNTAQLRFYHRPL